MLQGTHDRDGGLCGGSGGFGNFTNSWVMIASSGGLGWSQVGFERTYGYPLRWFSQEKSSTSLQTRYSSFNVGSEIGVRHTFRVLWIAECVCLRTYIDTYLWSTAPFNPFFASSGWGPATMESPIPRGNGPFGDGRAGSAVGTDQFHSTGRPAGERSRRRADAVHYGLGAEFESLAACGLGMRRLRKLDRKLLT